MSCRVSETSAVVALMRVKRAALDGEAVNVLFFETQGGFGILLEGWLTKGLPWPV